MHPRFLLVIVALWPLLDRSAAAQERDTVTTKGAKISGVVHDSVVGGPLAGAAVQLIVTDSAQPLGRTAISDSLGRFTFTEVPDGRYTLGFFHPMLDSLGLEPPLRELQVRGQPLVHVELAIPSPDRIRAAICGPRAPGYVGGVLVGVVRDARSGAPVAAATVTAEWLEITIRKGALERHTPRLAATTSETGWFAVCDVPGGGTMFVTAMRDADSTDVIDVEVPHTGFVRFDLYVGPSRVVAVEDTTQHGDSTLAGRRRIGDGRLSGTVRTAAAEWQRGRPLASARVRLGGGVESRTNELGEWALANAPLGTRILEVRALGYFPERRAVHIVADAAPLRIGLSTMKAMLDTIRVTATRLRPEMQEFEKRRRSGMGRYYTTEDILRRHLFNTSDLFRMVPGVRIEYGSGGAFDQPIRVRGVFGLCSPALYLDGHYIPSFQGLTVDEVDQWVNPEEIAGVEIYTSVVPPQFQQPFNQCGSIVIWTQPLLGPRSRMSLKRKLAVTSAFMASGILLGKLIVALAHR